MAFSEDQALKALMTIKDPVLERDIVAAGRLSDLSCQAGHVRVIVKLDPQEAKQFEPLPHLIETALGALPGVKKVSVMLTAHKAGPDIKRRLARKASPHPVRRPVGYQGDAFIDHVVAISSAKGGVGKSTVAINLAVALAKAGYKVGVLDADVHGPSLPLLTATQARQAKTCKVQGRYLIEPFEAYGVKLMSIGFLTQGDGSIVWRGPMVQGAISKMLWDVDWGVLDILLIDMPPGTGDPQLGLAQDIKPRGAVIVSTPQDLALSDARKGIDMFRKVNIPILGIVENMSLFICPDCGGAHHIFGTNGAKAEAEARGVPFLGSAPLHMAIRQSGDSGQPIAASDQAPAAHFMDIARHLADSLLLQVR